MRGQPFTAGITCDECPWRKDVPVGRFPPSRFRKLRRTVEQGLNPLFACHKTVDGKELACTGYLKSIDSENNFTVRLAIIRGAFNPKTLETKGPLFATYAEMEKANRRRKKTMPKLAHIGDVSVHRGEPQDSNPYKGGSGLIGPERRAALAIFKEGGDTSAFTLWYAPSSGGARRITAAEVDWSTSGL